MGSPVLSRSAAAVVAVLLTVTLAACEDEPEPDFSDDVTASGTPIPPATSSATTDSTPTVPVEPTLPAEAKEATKAGAEAFVEYYWEVVNYAQESGDVGTLRTLQTDSCQICAGGTRSIERIYGKGGRITGGTYEVLATKSWASDNGGWFVDVRLTVGRQVIRGAGRLNKTYPAGRSKHLLVVRQSQGAWQVASWEPL